MQSIPLLIFSIALLPVVELGYAGNWGSEYEPAVDYLINFAPHVSNYVGTSMVNLVPVYIAFSGTHGQPPNQISDFCKMMLTENDPKPWLIQIINKCFTKDHTMKRLGEPHARKVFDESCSFFIKLSATDALVGPNGNLKGSIDWETVKIAIQRS